MNKLMLAKSNSYGALAVFFLKHATVWEDFPALNEEVATFFSLKAKFDEVSQRQADDTTGFTDAKQARQASVEEQCLNLARKGLFWAIKVQHHEAIAVFDIGPGDFKVSHASQLLLARNVAAMLRQHQDALLPYRVLAADLSALDVAIEAAEGHAAIPTLEKKDRQVAGASLEAQSKLIDTAVEQIGRLVLSEYGRSHKDMVGQLLQVQKVVKPPVRHTTLRGKVRDAVTNEVLGGVYCDLLEVAGEEVYSDVLGFYEIKEFKAGLLTLELSKDGYETSRQVIQIKLGQTKELDVELKPTA